MTHSRLKTTGPFSRVALTLDGIILTEISRVVGLSISWISRLFRNTNPESAKKMDVRKRGRKPVDGLDNLLLLEVMMNYDSTGINRTGGEMFSKSKLIGNLQERAE